MKRICVILLAAALSASVFSCKEKTASDNEAGSGIKDSTMKEELKKTTENGGDAH
jgi:hypothetical protein